LKCPGKIYSILFSFFFLGKTKSFENNITEIDELFQLSNFPTTKKKFFNFFETHRKGSK